MMAYLAVGCGGFLGSVCRFALASAFPPLPWGDRAALPLGTLAVNLAGCLGIGLLFGIMEAAFPLSTLQQRFLLTGFLGGFTTFSAFGLETLQLMRAGNVAGSFTYVILSVVAGLFLTWAGFAAVTRLLSPVP